MSAVPIRIINRTDAAQDLAVVMAFPIAAELGPAPFHGDRAW